MIYQVVQVVNLKLEKTILLLIDKFECIHMNN